LEGVRQKFIFQSARMLVEDLAERADAMVQGETNGGAEKVTAAPKVTADSNTQVLCIPARDEADEIGAQMLMQLLRRKGIAASVMRLGTLDGDYQEEIDREKVKVACVVSVPPFGSVQTRRICRKLRSQYSEIRIVAAILTEQDVEKLQRKLSAMDAEETTSSLQMALSAAITQLAPPNDAAREADRAGDECNYHLEKP